MTAHTIVVSSTEEVNNVSTNQRPAEGILDFELIQKTPYTSTEPQGYISGKFSEHMVKGHVVVLNKWKI